MHNGCNSSIGVARECTTQARNKNFGAEFMGVRCNCTPRWRVHPLGGEESHFVIGRSGVVR